MAKVLNVLRGLFRYRDGLIWSLRKTVLKLIFQMAALHGRLFNCKLPSSLFGKKHSVKYQDKPFGGTHTSVVDPSGTPGTRPLLVQILSFSCSFQQKICKKIGWRTGLGNRRPSSGKVLDPPLNTLVCFKSEQQCDLNGSVRGRVSSSRKRFWTLPNLYSEVSETKILLFSYWFFMQIGWRETLDTSEP